MLIIFPAFILLKYLKAALEQVNVLIKFVLIIEVHSSNSYSSGLFLIFVPALLINIFNFPNSLATSSISLLHEFSLTTSTMKDLH